MATQTGDHDQERQARRPERTDRGGTGIGGSRARRIATGLVGGVLLAHGLRRRGLRGIATAFVGGWLLARALGQTTRLTRTLRSGTDLGSALAGRNSGMEAAAVARSITVGRPAADLYELWRDPDQLSGVLGEVLEVTAPGEDRLRWTVDGPRDRTVSWETRIVEDEPGELIRWETPADAMVSMDGAVRFRPAPGERGTEVTLSLDFEPPGGTVGAVAIDQLDVVPKTLADTALRRFKSLAETGEIPTLEGNPSGRGRGDLV